MYVQAGSPKEIAMYATAKALCLRREAGISARLLPSGTELKMNLSSVGIKGRSVQRLFWVLLVSLYVVPVGWREVLLSFIAAAALSPPYIQTPPEGLSLRQGFCGPCLRVLSFQLGAGHVLEP